MGHLTPFLRLATKLIHHHCRVTPHPTVSLTESQFISRFLSAFPQVTQLQFHLLPLDPSTANSNDPFWLRFEAIRLSAHLLSPLLTSHSPPLDALIYDVSLISSVIPVIESLHISNYILFPSSARMFSLFSHFPNFASKAIFGDVLEVIPGFKPIPRSSIPPLPLIPDSLFANIVKEDGLPPVFAVGTLVPCEFEKGQWDEPLRWLNEHEDGSVVAVGGLVSHCGWNLVIETAWHGVTILAWPQGGDQKINAEVVEMSGVGMWEKSWGWGGKDDQMVVKGEDVGKRIREMMGKELLRVQAAQIREEARKAFGVGGNCERIFKQFVEEWK
ncbi:hypothetical protein SO802_011315 [Lithocarpus litseifolius]|uniref:Uncharacterized protein n=1 Tax=Lithocarpus litseifolius TaxID=425828 RepID=A0AAW2D100_9ROSI